jgi:hypothetical protein
MMLSKYCGLMVIFLLIASFIPGCGNAAVVPSTSIITATSYPSPIVPTATIVPQSPTYDLSTYAFPDSIDPTKQYMFYLHGKIIEDEGIPAFSTEYGEYEYQAILEKLSRNGFVVISEQRAKNTDGVEYAKRVTEQIETLLEAGVLAKNISIVGASKGAWISIYVSHLLGNDEVKYVIMAICNPENLELFIQDQILLYGNVLSIYDSSDELAGSCQELFLRSEANGLSNYEEVVLNVRTGHGMLYKPLDEWIIPVIQWVGRP